MQRPNINSVRYATVRVGKYDLHYAEAGLGPAVLLIHGLAGDHSAWNDQIEAWSWSMRVIAPDSRGAGRSTQVDEPITMEAIVDDFLALMDSIGIARFPIVGRLMGGCIGQHIALKAPQRVKSLATLASAARFDLVGKRCLANIRDVFEWTKSWAVHARHSVQNFVALRFFNKNPDRVAAIEKIIGGKSRLQACYMRQSHAVIDHDRVDRLRLPHADWIPFKASAHFFLMEESDRFMRVMSDWFSRRAAVTLAVST